jgi:hypothetical protein
MSFPRERWCPTCERLRTIRPDGTFTAHNLPKPAVLIVICAASNKLPDCIFCGKDDHWSVNCPSAEA